MPTVGADPPIDHHLFAWRPKVFKSAISDHLDVLVWQFIPDIAIAAVLTHHNVFSALAPSSVAEALLRRADLTIIAGVTHLLISLLCIPRHYPHGQSLRSQHNAHRAAQTIHLEKEWQESGQRGLRGGLPTFFSVVSETILGTS